MKAIILTCSTGHGHNSAAMALSEAFERTGIACEVADAFSFADRSLTSAFNGVFMSTVKNEPSAFGYAYRAGELVSSAKVHSPVYFANALYARRLADYITKNNFDAAVCPHLFPAEALSYIRERDDFPVRLYAVATDYACIPFWEELRVDAYFLSHADIAGECARRGIPPERMTATGIPVLRRFSEAMPRAMARDMFDIPRNARVFLVMTGGDGCGNAPEVTRALIEEGDANMRVIVLAGANEKLRTALEREWKDEPRVRALGFTKEVPVLMDACDVLLTKPGGLSSTEAAVKHVAMVHVGAIPGVETLNARFFASRGLSVSAQDARSAAKEALILADSPARMEEMCERQAREINPRAADDIARAVRASSTQ